MDLPSVRLCGMSAGGCIELVEYVAANNASLAFSSERPMAEDFISLCLCLSLEIGVVATCV